MVLKHLFPRVLDQRSILGIWQNMSLFAPFFFISVIKSCKNMQKNKEKEISSSVRISAALKCWSKYPTLESQKATQY